MIDSTQNKEKILQEFLIIAASDGWSLESLQQALKSCQIEEKFLPLIFENDLLDLLKFYVETYNHKASQQIVNDQNFSSSKIREKIATLILKRLEVEIPNKLALQRLLNFLLNPKNLLTVKYGIRPAFIGFKLCYQIADHMWYSIGDNATDFNFYTKRMILAKVFYRSFFKFLKDDSADLALTKNFITDEINKVMKIQRYKAIAKDFSFKIKNEITSILLKEDGVLKSPTDLIKSLPFIRLFK